MQIPICNNVGRVLFTAEIDCTEDTPLLRRIGLAVAWAVANGANLTCANLSGADLAGANLTGTNLSGANLAGANLAGANLCDADLKGTNLTSANLSGANLVGTDLAGANLADANLADANLVGTDLTGANMLGTDLTGANLFGADLTGANMTRTTLTSANLTGANMTGTNLLRANIRDTNLAAANLHSVKTDFIAEVLKLAPELEYLRSALAEGRVNGAVYAGECACLAGTLAKAKHIESYTGGPIPAAVPFLAKSSSLREVFFLAIRPGDTPETNPASKIALEWTDEAIAIRNGIVKAMTQS